MRPGPDPSPVPCVMWHAPQSSPPPKLVEVLRGKRLDLARTTDGLGACAEVFRARRRGGPGQPAVLLLVEPEALVELAMVVDAIERYAPEVARWVYRPGQKLRAATRLDLRPERPEVQVRAPAADGLAVSAGGVSSASVRPAPDARPAALSGEELDWLLGEQRRSTEALR